MDIMKGTSPTLEIGGRVFTDLTNLKTLICTAETTNNGTFREINGSAGYQVPVGKKFKVLGVKALVANATVQGAAGFSYADNDIGINSASALTNQVQLFGASSAGFAYLTTSVGVFENAFCESNAPFVPAGKYLIQNAPTSFVICYVYGVEVSA